MNRFMKLITNRPLQIICNTAILVFFTYTCFLYAGLDPLANNFENKKIMLQVSLIIQSILVLVVPFNFYFIIFRPESLKLKTPKA